MSANEWFYSQQLRLLYYALKWSKSQASTRRALPVAHRRAITLVQVLAIGDYNGLLALYDAWQLEPMPEPDTLVMVTRLAEHALEHGRENH